MTEKKIDPTSDAARSDPNNADKDREKLKKDAERGLKKAVHETPGEKR